MGVRAALGARPSELLAAVMQNGLALATIGTVAGLIVAFNVSRLLASRLYGVAPFDAVTYLSGGAVVLIVAAAASAVPGWRASRVDPIEALRHD